MALITNTDILLFNLFDPVDKFIIVDILYVDKVDKSVDKWTLGPFPCGKPVQELVIKILFDNFFSLL